MPKLSGIDAMVQLKQDNPGVKVVFLTMHREVAYARPALEAGASSFVLKHSAPEELIIAIKAALAGQTFITPALAGEVLQSIQSDPDGSKDALASLTPRQREILQLLGEGKTPKEISGLLGISTRTVEIHKHEMMQSAGLQNSAELVHFAIKHGIVEI